MPTAPTPVDEGTTVGTSGGPVAGTDFVAWAFDPATGFYTYITSAGNTISSKSTPAEIQAKHGVGTGGSTGKVLGDKGSAIGGPFSNSQLNAIDSVTGAISSIPDFLKLITSGNFWDRVLFIFGGLLLVIVGLVLLLHKSIPPVIPV